MSLPTVTDFLKAQADAELEAEVLGERSGYAIWPLDRKYPSIKSLYPNASPGERVVEPGHKPPNRWTIRVRLSRDPRRFFFSCPSKRDAENLGRQFLSQLREYLDDESADMLWNKFVLSAARHVDARLKQVCGIDPPSRPIAGPRRADGHEHEWHWTGTYTEARPFPVWHMRCGCGQWALLANKVGTVSGEWVAFDDAVHDIRLPDGTPEHEAAVRPPE